jgi:hypothetical protein
VLGGIGVGSDPAKLDPDGFNEIILYQQRDRRIGAASEDVVGSWIVVSENIRRRHLNAAQRAILVALAYPEKQQGKQSTSLETKEEPRFVAGPMRQLVEGGRIEVGSKSPFCDLDFDLRSPPCFTTLSRCTM